MNLFVLNSIGIIYPLLKKVILSKKEKKKNRIHLFDQKIRTCLDFDPLLYKKKDKLIFMSFINEFVRTKYNRNYF